MSAFFLALLLYAGASVAAAPNSAAASPDAERSLHGTQRPITPTGSAPQALEGLFPNDAGLKVRNIEGVTGAVLVKSRIIDRTETENGHGKGAQGKSLFRSFISNDQMPSHLGKPNDRRQVTPTANQTQILLTFLHPVKESGKNDFLDRTTTKSPSLMKIVAGESDLQVEYLETQNRAPISLFRGSGGENEFQDSPALKLEIPGRVPSLSEKFASSQKFKKKNGNKWSSSEQSEIAGLDDILESGLIKVKNQPSPQDDPDLIHLSQTIQEAITVSRSVPSVTKTVTNTITKTATEADRRPISEVVTQVLTITSVTVTTTTKTETSIVPVTPTTTAETMTMPPMQRPTKGTFLSPMPPRTSTTATSSTSIRPTSVVESLTETSLLDPTDPDFFLPLNLRDRRPDLEEPNGEKMQDEVDDMSVNANITQIMMLKDQAQNGESVNKTKVLLFTLLKNMTNMTDTRLQILNEILKTPEDVTFFLQTLVRRINEITNQTQEITEIGGNVDGAGFAPVIRDAENDGEKESIVPQDAINTKLDVWPNGRGSTEKFVKANFPPTIADPFRCRKKGVEYPITIDYNELRERINSGAIFLIDVRNATELQETGRLPWSYNLPLHELYEAFKLQSSSFQSKFGFPKPKPSSPIVTLTGGADGRAMEAWNELQKFGYCNVKLYLGSYLDYIENGGNLVPYFPSAEDKQDTDAPNADSGDSGSSRRNFRFNFDALEDHDDGQIEMLGQTSRAPRTLDANVDEEAGPTQHANESGRELGSGQTLPSSNVKEGIEIETPEVERVADDMNNEVNNSVNFKDELQHETENVTTKTLNSSNISLRSETTENSYRNATENSEGKVDFPALLGDSNATTDIASPVGNETNLITQTNLTKTETGNLSSIFEDSPLIPVESSENSGSRDTELRLDEDDGSGDGQTVEYANNIPPSRTNAHQLTPTVKATKADLDRSLPTTTT